MNVLSVTRPGSTSRASRAPRGVRRVHQEVHVVCEAIHREVHSPARQKLWKLGRLEFQC